MIKAHRHHAAIQIYGLCNEGQCGAEHGAAAAAFMTVKNSLDPERPQNGNMVGDQTYNFPHVDMITESGNAELNGWHEQFPDMPISTGEVRRPLQPRSDVMRLRPFLRSLTMRALVHAAWVWQQQSALRTERD
jgi:hypothetical protein